NLILLALTPDILAVYQTQWNLEMIESLHFPLSMVKVVLNRFQSKGGVPHKEVEAVMPCDVIARIPSDGKAMGLAINKGIPVVIDSPRSGASDALKGLASLLGSEEGEKIFVERQGRLSMSMPIGKRAITIPVGPTQAVGGFIKQGDHVDVLGMFAAAKLKLQPEAKTTIVTLFQDVLVLASAGSSITLALSPEEAGIISIAQNEGKILLVLRPQAETGEHTLPLLSMETLKKKYAPAVIVEPEEEGEVIEIFRGLQRETVPLLIIPKEKKEE
ncbi:unnamed protein product, partial [marine sediment metagenome]